MKSIVIPCLACFMIFQACDRPQEQKKSSAFSPVVVESKGRIFPPDSMVPPTVVPAGKPRVVKAGRPEVVLANTNTSPAGELKVVKAGTPCVTTPGKDSIPPPRITRAVVKPFVAGIPERVEAKDPKTKDVNPQNFSTFNKLHGLRNSIIHCFFQDREGNLWFGTGGGGACRYDGKYFTNYTVKEGLKNGFVTGVFEDRSGVFWFTTWSGGVNRYDGKYMTHFTVNEGLSDNVALCAFQDHNGAMWFGTMVGLDKFDGTNFTHYAGKEVTGIEEDDEGNLWLATWKGGLLKFDGKSFFHYTKREGFCDNIIRSMYRAKSGKLLLSTAHSGVCMFDGKSFTTVSEEQGLKYTRIYSSLLDKKGSFWFGTGFGVVRYDGTSLTDFTEKEGLYANPYELFEDRSGNLWCGGEGSGISRWDGGLFSHFTMNEGLSDNRITSIFQDRDGILWFSTWNGGLNRYDGKSFSHYSSREGFGNNMVVSIMQDRTGKIWFVTYGSGLICYDGKTFSHLTEKEGLPCNDLDDILEDKNGCFWISTDCNGVVKYDGKTFTTFNDKQGLCYNGVLCSLEDEKGNLWFGTAKGLSCFNGKTFTNYSVKDGLGSNWIETILQDRDGIMWFGAREGGVTRYDGTTFMNFTEKEGLCCNDVKSMIQDKNGNLWFGTTMGLSRLSPGYMVNLENKQGNGNERQPVLFTNFTYEDGFHGVGCINKSLIEDKAGTIWIGANDRLTAYHPEGYALDTIPPTIQISGLLVFDEKIPWLALENKRDTGFVLGNGVRFKNFRFDSISRWYYLPLNLSLPHVNNYLTFQFIGITLKQSKKVKYQYKLEGLDDNWSALTSRAEAPYGNIPPGRYTFKVKSMNSEGYWSKEASYSFTIRPPWWRTWWAFSGYILLFIGAIWFTIWSAIENQRKKIRLIIGERNRIARELHDDIGAELTRITMLSQILQKNDKVEGDIREKLRKISETGKKVLGSIGEIIWTMNPQKDNLDSLAAYIRRFVTEYLETNGIDINIEFPAEIPARDISDEYRRNVFLVVKEAISNISKYSKATSVRISLTIVDKLAEVEISDNGTGFSVKEKENWGNGLRNMNQRMKDIGGTFLITSETNRGTLVRLSFPVR